VSYRFLSNGAPSEGANGSIGVSSPNRHMRGSLRPRGLAKLLLLTLLASAKIEPLPAIERPELTVVELFTSQGCSSCPPANANAAALSESQDVLVLSYGVTYWNYLGWVDTFAQPEFTKRQEDYEAPLGKSGPFTPQVVVDGRRDTVGSDRSEIEHLILESSRKDVATIEISEREIKIGKGNRSNGEVDIWLIRYDPRTIEVPVRRGENGGRTLPHKNVVRSLQRVGTWDGNEISFTPPPSDPKLRTAVLLQLARGGPILAAARK
jgi:hypothetical protein